MPNYYELKQTTLMEMEIEGLIEKIKNLEVKLAIKELEVKQLKEKLQPFISEQEKREAFLKRRDEMDLQISQMLVNFHNKMK